MADWFLLIMSLVLVVGLAWSVIREMRSAGLTNADGITTVTVGLVPDIQIGHRLTLDGTDMEVTKISDDGTTITYRLTEV